VAQQAKLKEKQADLKHVASKLQAAEQQLARQILIEMEAKAKAAITLVIKEGGIGLLLDAQAALHADTSYDITAKITKQLNAS
jgi:outer membrane protein